MSMKAARLAFTVALLFYSFHSFALAVPRVSNQENLTLTGHVRMKDSGSVVRRFTIKLYPPKNRKRAVLMATANDSGDFAFTELPPSSYLLEVYLGTDLVNQQVVVVDGNKDIWIRLH